MASLFTEFYCQSTGSNLNAGSTANDAATITSVNGAWNTTSKQFTASVSSDFASGVAAGDFASVFVDGATVTGYVSVVNAVNPATGLLTLSSGSFGGTPPSTLASGMTCKIGGAWKGPNGSVAFPFNLVNDSMWGISTSYTVRVNFKTPVAYAVTASIPVTFNGVTYQGYTSTPGDGGRAVINGPSTGTGFQLLAVNGTNNSFRDLEFGYNGGTGATSMVVNGADENLFERCVFHHSRGFGIAINNNTVGSLIECEAYSNNLNNAANSAGISMGGRGIMRRCSSHNNTTSNTDGILISGGYPTEVQGCISYNNAKRGFVISNTVITCLVGCDAYNNGLSGAEITSATSLAVTFENCNFIKNGGWGINSAGGLLTQGYIRNCGFGSGTMANTSGEIVSFLMTCLDVRNNVTYPANVTPWVLPDAGEFLINLAQAKNTGLGYYFNSSTVGYPDIGAGQHQDGAGSSPSSWSTP